MIRFLLPALLLCSAALAQSQAPMVVVGGEADKRPASEIEQERILTTFPEWAVTRVGAATGGYDKDVPVAPAAAPAPTPAPAPETPKAPEPPAAPEAPISKLWPADTVPIFMKSCVGYQPKLIVPCNCVIGKLMLAMPHDEFLKLTAKGTIEQDYRLQNIRVACAVEAAKKD